jgi:hypothetical protein
MFDCAGGARIDEEDSEERAIEAERLDPVERCAWPDRTETPG